MIFANALRDESLPGVTGEILRPGRRRYKDVHAAFYQLASFPVAAVQEIPSLAHAEDRHDVTQNLEIALEEEVDRTAHAGQRIVNRTVTGEPRPINREDYARAIWLPAAGL